MGPFLFYHGRAGVGKPVLQDLLIILLKSVGNAFGEKVETRLADYCLHAGFTKQLWQGFVADSNPDPNPFSTPDGSQAIATFLNTGLSLGSYYMKTTAVTDTLKLGATYTLTVNGGNFYRKGNFGQNPPKNNTQITTQLIAGSTILGSTVLTSNASTATVSHPKRWRRC